MIYNKTFTVLNGRFSHLTLALIKRLHWGEMFCLFNWAVSWLFVVRMVLLSGNSLWEDDSYTNFKNKDL